MKVARRKVIIVGIDGASPSMVDRMLDQGLLPNLAEIRRRGVSAVLESTRHPITPAAWTTLLTGLNPGMHGLIDFRRRDFGSLELRVLRGADRDGETIWHILSRVGHTVGVFNVPMTFPPERVRGFWISGMDTPWKNREFAFPSSLVEWLDRQVGGYEVDVGQGTTTDTEETYLQATLHLQQVHRRAFEVLLERYKPDTAMGVFVSTDRLQHAFWRYIDPQSEAFASPQAKAAQEGVLQCYQDIDDFLGWLLRKYVDEGAVLMVVSDHGFGPLYKDVYLNQWLLEQGYLRLREIPTNWDEGSSLLERIDWEHTLAYSFGYFGNIYLNLMGREPLGIVRPGREQQEVLDRLKKDLEAWRLPGEDTPLVDGLFEPRELHSGPYVEWGPDLLVTMRNYAYMSRDSFDVPRGILFSEPMAFQPIPNPIKHSGNHRMEGIFYAVGEGVGEGRRLTPVRIVDIAPTILHLVGHSIPGYMDGRVLTDILEKGTPPVLDPAARFEPAAPTLHRLACQVHCLEERSSLLQKSLVEALGYQRNVQRHWAVRTWRLAREAYRWIAGRIRGGRVLRKSEPAAQAYRSAAREHPR